MALTDPRHQELIDILEDCLANIHRHTVRMIATLAEIEVKRVHLELGYSSMWDFCIKRYNMTKDETHPRLAVARLVQNYPQLLGALERGEVTMTNLMLLRNMIDATNVDALVALSSRKSKEDVIDLITEIDPKAAEGGMGKKKRDESAEVPLPRQKKPDIESVAAGIFMLTLAFDRAFRDEIEETRELVRHMIPSGDLLEVTRAAFRALREQAKKTKPVADKPAAEAAASEKPAAAEELAATNKPSAKRRPSKDPTYISMETRRAVYARDGGRCTFIGAEGHRCDARKGLQFDHIDLRSRGGVGTMDNVRLRCRAHNLHTAKKSLGETFVAEKIAAAKKARAAKKEQSEKTKADAAAAAIEAPEPQKLAGAIKLEEALQATTADATPIKAGTADAPRQAPVRRGPEVANARKAKAKHSLLTKSKRPRERAKGR